MSFYVSILSKYGSIRRGIKGSLHPDPKFRCTWCLNNAQPNDGSPKGELLVGEDKLEFCFLSDILYAGGSCKLDAVTCCKFPHFVPLLTIRHLSLLTRGHVSSLCVSCVMLNVSETWAMTTDILIACSVTRVP